VLRKFQIFCRRLIAIINHKVEGLFCLKLPFYLLLYFKGSKANDQKLDDEKVVEEKMQTYRALWNKRDASLKGKK